MPNGLIMSCEATHIATTIWFQFSERLSDSGWNTVDMSSFIIRTLATSLQLSALKCISQSVTTG